MKNVKIALVYDRVNTPHGGAEHVLLAIHELFPDAPLYTSVYDAQRAKWASVFQVRTSFLQKIPFAKRLHRLLLALMPLAFESVHLDDYDIVISISSGEAKGVLTKPGQLHVCYLLTPTRYLWSHTEEYQRHWLTGALRKIIFQYVRWWDESAALRPDVFIPISKLVAARCAKYYHRKTADVVYPTVGLQENTATSLELLPPEVRAMKNNYYLVVARLVPYKKIDLAIDACFQAGKNLVIVGQGPDVRRLQRRAKKRNATAKIFFAQAVQAANLGAYYYHCRGFLALAEEDFGITTLEAQRYGKPVIIYEKSGGAELVEDGQTGIYFSDQQIENVTEAMQILEQLPWDARYIQTQARKYTQKTFQESFYRSIENAWQKMTKGSYVNE